MDSGWLRFEMLLFLVRSWLTLKSLGGGDRLKAADSLRHRFDPVDRLGEYDLKLV